MFYVVVDASVLLLVIHNEDQSAAAARGAQRQAHPSCKIQCKMGTADLLTHSCPHTAIGTRPQTSWCKVTL